MSFIRYPEAELWSAELCYYWIFELDFIGFLSVARVCNVWLYTGFVMDGHNYQNEVSGSFTSGLFQELFEPLVYYIMQWQFCVVFYTVPFNTTANVSRGVLFRDFLTNCQAILKPKYTIISEYLKYISGILPKFMPFTMEDFHLRWHPISSQPHPCFIQRLFV